MIAWIHGTSNQEVELRTPPLTSIFSVALAKTLLPILRSLCSVVLEILIPKGGMLKPGDTPMISLKLRLLLTQFEILMSLN